jgi:exonuclease III
MATADIGPATQFGRGVSRRDAPRATRQVSKSSVRGWNLVVGTWNVSSLTNKLDELVDEASRCRLDVVGVSSTKRSGSGTEDLRGWKLFYSGVDTSVRAQAGVGILVSPRLVDRVGEWFPISCRVSLLRLHLMEGKDLVVIQAYAPNLTAEYPAFLADLDRGFERVKRDESVMLLGDFNAHVGADAETWKGVIGRHGDAHLNTNGELLLDFCAGNGLSVMNTYFQHKNIHKYTWYRDALTQKSLIDFIIVSADLKRSVLDVRVKRGAELSTDHHLVVGNFRCNGRLPPRRRNKAVMRVKWEMLKDSSVQENFAAAIAEKFQSVPETAADVETEWTMFRTALLGAATECCGLKRVGMAHDGRTLTSWWTPEVKQAVGEKKVCFKQWIADKTLSNRTRYEEARRAAAEVVAEAKAKAWDRFGDEMATHYHTAIKTFWQTVRRSRRSGGTALQVLRDKEGRVITHEAAVVERWREYFEELLNPTSASPPVPELQIRAVTNLDPDETRRAISRLKSGKAAGGDEIRPEMLKAIGGAGIDWLTRVFQVAWDSGEAPADWQDGVVVPIFKKGDKTECANYRGITLLSLPGKIYAKILESRVRGIVEPRVSDEQCGFRPGRSTTDQVFSLRQVFEKSWEFAQPVFMTFVDLEKAYDRVPRDELWECLREYEVDGELIRAIQSLYKRSSACVRVNGIKSTSFTVGVGLRQGCVLSPILFTCFMDRIVKRSRGPECVRIGDVEVARLLFADDLAILASSEEDLQRALERFAAECGRVGMRVSTSKTEVMVLDRRKVDCSLHVSGTQLRQVEEFKYLGIMFTSDGRQEKELDRRINLASVVMRELWRLAGNERIPMEAQIAVFNSLYKSVLTYGHESWILTERTRSRVQAAEMRYLRRILGVSRRHRLRNDSIREAVNLEPLLLQVERSQLRWLGHVIRMDPERLPRRLLFATPAGSRPRGRPRTRWTDQIDAFLSRAGTDFTDAVELATDRTLWHTFVSRLTPATLI